MPPKTSQPEFENGFRIDDNYLSRNLFKTCSVPSLASSSHLSTVRSTTKLKTTLNATYLPHLHQSIKRCFTHEERTSLKDHDVQTFLIECSLSEVLFNSVEALRDSILAHIYATPHFWLNGSEHQLQAKEQQLADQHYQTHFERWKNDNPNSKPEAFVQIYHEQLESQNKQPEPPAHPSRVYSSISICQFHFLLLSPTNGVWKISSSTQFSPLTSKKLLESNLFTISRCYLKLDYHFQLHTTQSHK